MNENDRPWRLDLEKDLRDIEEFIRKTQTSDLRKGVNMISMIYDDDTHNEHTSPMSPRLLFKKCFMKESPLYN